VKTTRQGVRDLDIKQKNRRKVPQSDLCFHVPTSVWDEDEREHVHCLKCGAEL
jgi:hypothetical protein